MHKNNYFLNFLDNLPSTFLTESFKNGFNAILEDVDTTNQVDSIKSKLTVEKPKIDEFAVANEVNKDNAGVDQELNKLDQLY